MRTRRLTCALFTCCLAACSGSVDDPGGAPGAGGTSSPGTTSSAGTGGAVNGANAGGAPGNASGGANQGSAGANGTGTAGAVGAGGSNMAAADGGSAAVDGGAGRDATTVDSAGSGVPLKYPPAFGTGDIAAGIAHLNEYRAGAGVSSITLDEASSAGCAAHLDYLVEEQRITGMVGLSHDELDTTNTKRSTAGETAGKQSDLSWGGSSNGGGQPFGSGVDLWINGLYHRRPLLDPGLVKVGAASKNGYNCVNYAASGNTVPKKLPGPTMWPASGMTDVPRTFTGNEGPCPSNPTNPQAGGTCAKAGFIPSATFYGWGTYNKSAITQVASATLTDDVGGTSVPLLAYYADAQSGHDPAHGFVADEIAIVPQAALAASKTYRVDISAVVQGTMTNLSWKFTTGTRNE